MTNMLQPAAALPMQAMPMGQMQMGQMPPGMVQAGPAAMAPQMAAAYGQQPVYVSSMSQVPPGAIPVSQGMLAQALGQGQLGAQVVQPPTTTSPLKSMLKGAAIGAAGGAAFGLIPFLPLGLMSGALVGAGVGAAIGLFTGLRKRKAEGEFHTMQQAEAHQQAANAAQVMPAPGTVPPTHGTPGTPKQGVVMGPETRRKWAAKVAAERAAAARP